MFHRMRPSPDVGSPDLWLSGDVGHMTRACQKDRHIWTHVPAALPHPYPYYTVCRFCGKRKYWDEASEKLRRRQLQLLQQMNIRLADDAG